MKRTKIRYRVRNDKAKITALENVASKIDIAKEFGVKAALEYVRDFPHYYRVIRDGRTSENTALYVVDENSEAIEVHIGDVIPLVLFRNTIDVMKRAGGRLSEICKQEIEVII